MTVFDAPGVPLLPPGDYQASQDFADDGDLSDSYPPSWGVFQDGGIIVEPDTITAFEYRQEFNVSDYPVEEGGFASYNKVQTPYDVRVRLVKGGSVDERSQFLASIDAIISTLDLYEVNTPEQIYTNLNFTHRDFRRTNENGVGLIAVDLWAVEIRQTGESGFSNAQQAGGNSQQDDGNTQPQNPTGGQGSTFESQGVFAPGP